jgi:benzoylformate decarboxylase
LLPEGATLVTITSDPDEAARAPMGHAAVADVKFTLEALLAELDDFEPDREPPPPRPDPEPVPDEDPMSPSAAAQALADVFPDYGIAVVESPSATLALRNRLRLSKPGSWYFGAGGGLGFGLPAAVGVQLAEPERPVVCVAGEGSVQYAVQTFWTAVAYDVPVTFLILRNEEYAILKWFAALEDVTAAPGLDLPKLDTASLAAGYGVESKRADDPEELREALREAIADPAPRLVETRVAPGMALA